MNQKSNMSRGKAFVPKLVILKGSVPVVQGFGTPFGGQKHGVTLNVFIFVHRNSLLCTDGLRIVVHRGHDGRGDAWNSRPSGRRRRRRIWLGFGPVLLALFNLNGRGRTGRYVFCGDDSPSTRLRSLTQYQVGVDTWMPGLEVIPVLVGASPFKLAR